MSAAARFVDSAKVDVKLAARSNLSRSLATHIQQPQLRDLPKVSWSLRKSSWIVVVPKY